MASYEYRISRVIVLILFIIGVPASTRAQPNLKCRAADDTTLGLIAELKAWAATTDPERISQRDNIFHVPVVDARSLSVVTDEKVCAKIIAGYSAFPKLAYTPTRVYVVKLGSKGYAAYDPEKIGGEFTAVHIFSTKFVRIGGWVG